MMVKFIVQLVLTIYYFIDYVKSYVIIRGCGQNPGHFDTVKDYGVTLFQRAGSCRTHVV